MFTSTVPLRITIFLFLIIEIVAWCTKLTFSEFVLMFDKVFILFLPFRTDKIRS